MGARFWFSTWMLVRTAGWIILLHLVEIAIWAFFYAWDHGMPDLPSAFYFSAVTYTTTGYGDLLLPNEWRLVGGVEALTGILMCGWSAAFFFAVVSRMNETRSQTGANLTYVHETFHPLAVRFHSDHCRSRTPWATCRHR